jgi:hypothetical protein
MLDYLPWLISALTIISTVLQGNLWKNVWVLNFGIQLVYLVWILLSENYGFLPLTFTLMVIYVRNHLKWNKE